jgi:signal transduction histidine kinase
MTASGIPPATVIAKHTGLDDVLQTLSMVDGGCAMTDTSIANPRYISMGMVAKHMHAQTQHLTERLRDMHHDLTIANKQAGRFISSLNHELRTPLNAIIGFSEIIQNTHHVHDIHQHNAYVIEAGHHMLKLVNTILDYHGLMSKNPERHMVSIGAIAHKVLHMMKGAWPDRQQDINMRLDEDMPDMIMGHDRIMTQVLINVVSNACKFCPRNAIDIVIRLSGTDLIMSVRDHGDGLPEHIQKEMFVPFTPGGHAKSGSGLGLSITKVMVESLNGIIQWSSIPGKGTTFTITIPHVVTESRLHGMSTRKRPSGLISMTS